MPHRRMRKFLKFHIPSANHFDAAQGKPTMWGGGGGDVIVLGTKKD